MKIKLDENLGRRGIELLRSAGHDVMSLRDQGLQGERDETVYRVCAEEGRVLITLDHDFGQVLRFPPDQSAGREFLALAESQTPVGALWIIEPGRVRVHLRRD